MHPFGTFTPDRFQAGNGPDADESEAICARRVNTQINYASCQSRHEMTAALSEIIQVLRPDNHPFSKQTGVKFS